MRFIKRQRNAEGNRRQDADFVTGVDAFNVKRRVGFGVAFLLCNGQHVGERCAFAAHFGQDEVRRAVDDAGDPLDAVSDEAFAQRFDDRNATGNRRLERDDHALGAGSGEDFVAVQGKQRFVGGDYVFAVGNRFKNQRFGNAVTADQFDDDIDIVIFDDGHAVVSHHRAPRDHLIGER